MFDTVKAPYTARRSQWMPSPLLQAMRIVLEVSSFLSQSWYFTRSPACCFTSALQNLAFGAYLAEQRFVASACTFVVPCSLYPSFGATVAARGEVSSTGATRLQHGYNPGHMVQSCSAVGAHWCRGLLELTGSRCPTSTEIQWDPGSRHPVKCTMLLQVRLK